ncbi:MAG TPA: hypothetical protein VEU62_18910 [Bryobacterales bacterium]|nr:hypothetical protein [Bryobacterales bacterium]
MNPGDVVIAVLAGARVTKLRPADPTAETDYLLADWRAAGLRSESWFRLYLITARQSDASVIGHLSNRDWSEIRRRVQTGLAI